MFCACTLSAVMKSTASGEIVPAAPKMFTGTQPFVPPPAPASGGSSGLVGFGTVGDAPRLQVVGLVV